MKISAGCALYQRKPSDAPVMEPQKMVSSLAPGVRARSRYSREFGVPGDIGQHRHGAGRDDHQADRQAVQPVGEIHRVRRPTITRIMNAKKADERQRIRVPVVQQRIDQQIRLERS
jgi:hypothetical protein